jgi:sorbitol/mannitol transport system substrate-binding protein
MGLRRLAALAFGVVISATVMASAQTLTIATVNNADMINMQKLSPTFEAATGIKLNWVVLEENVLRTRITTDISTKGGQFDIITIGAYEVPIWGKLGWLMPLDDCPKNYDYADIFEPVRNGVTVNGHMYAVPFYAESVFTFYRKDLFQKAGLTMPEQPTYDQVRTLADKLNDPAHGVYGICLRGKAGWGENMAYFSLLVNTYGGRWFDMNWQPQINTAPWKEALTYYIDLLRKDGPPGSSSNGFNENRALFATGKCAMWIDYTSASGSLYNPSESQVADKTAFAKAPIAKTDHGSAGAWFWAFAIPPTSKHIDDAKKFLAWSTSKEYISLVGEKIGWVSAPGGTRKSTYEHPEYLKAAPFAEYVVKGIMSADPAHPTAEPVPYIGLQFVAIPEFQAIGTAVGQQISSALSGQQSIDQALATAQASTENVMKQAGYIQ